LLKKGGGVALAKVLAEMPKLLVLLPKVLPMLLMPKLSTLC
jgi:hypothetical protein